jgi:hypothetical protein
VAAWHQYQIGHTEFELITWLLRGAESVGGLQFHNQSLNVNVMRLFALPRMSALVDPLRGSTVT